MSPATKCLVFAFCVSLGSAAVAQTINKSRLEAYRAEYKDAATPVKYVLVHADGSPCCGNEANTRAYLLDITAPAPAKLKHSAEIDRLLKEKFEVEIDNESVLKQPQGDFLVVTMLRPAEYNKKYVPCAGGMGESRAYLVSIDADNATVLNREFGDCGREYKIINDGTDVGYEVSDVGTHANPIRYLVHGNKVVRQNGAR
jgi:hypothetical protein